MDVRIGVIHTVKEIDIELPSDADREAIRSSVEKVLADETATFWITDRLGREYAVPASKIAYIELGGADKERRIGFGG